jgi:hypothetical protein
MNMTRMWTWRQRAADFANLDSWVISACLASAARAAFPENIDYANKIKKLLRGNNEDADIKGQHIIKFSIAWSGITG